MQILAKYPLVAEQSAHFVRMEQLELLFSNGARRDYRRIVKPKRQAVMIVPLLDANTVLLVREYAAGSEQYELVLPKGQVDDGESLTEAALRELAEEAGYSAHKVDFVKSFSIAPTFMGHITHCFVARDLFAHRLVGDEPEEMEVTPWALDDLETLIARGDCTEARTIAAILLVRAQLAAGQWDD